MKVINNIIHNLVYNIKEKYRIFFNKKEYTVEEIKHNNWIIIRDDVLDVSSFLKNHPGGEQNLKNYFGKDATYIFFRMHPKKTTRWYMKKYVIGKVKKCNHGLFNCSCEETYKRI